MSRTQHKDLNISTLIILKAKFADFGMLNFALEDVLLTARQVSHLGWIKNWTERSLVFLQRLWLMVSFFREVLQSKLAVGTIVTLQVSMHCEKNETKNKKQKGTKPRKIKNARQINIYDLYLKVVEESLTREFNKWNIWGMWKAPSQWDNTARNTQSNLCFCVCTDIHNMSATFIACLHAQG